MRKTVLICVVALGAAIAAAARAMPVTIQSTLFDADRNVLLVGPLEPDPGGNPVQNGDFVIFRIPTAVDLTVGNGIDERTRGTFDFRADENYSQFVDLLRQPHGKITSAVLSLVLLVVPYDAFYTNDQISLENGPFVGDPQIGQQLENNLFLEGGMAKLIMLDLLDFYSREQLVNFLSGGIGDFFGDGRIAITYGDDAFVTGANLRLTADIPEPGTLALLALGTLSVVVLRARRRRDVAPLQWLAGHR